MKTTNRSRTLAALAALALALTLAACGGSSSDDSGSHASSTTSHDQADVTFAAEMVPHHQQALRMVAMTKGRTLTPEFATLTTDIRKAQTPEITEMTGWLDSWGEQPDASGGMMSGGMSGNGMAGMMSNSDFLRLRHAGSTAFEAMWLRMMIVHHQGAIDMARTEIKDGEYAPALALAHSIETSQQAQIDQMRQMLSR